MCPGGVAGYKDVSEVIRQIVTYLSSASVLLSDSKQGKQGGRRSGSYYFCVKENGYFMELNIKFI